MHLQISYLRLHKWILQSYIGETDFICTRPQLMVLYNDTILFIFASRVTSKCFGFGLSSNSCCLRFGFVLTRFSKKSTEYLFQMKTIYSNMKEPLHVYFSTEIWYYILFSLLYIKFWINFLLLRKYFFVSVSCRIAGKWNLFCQIRVGLRVNDHFFVCQFWVRYWVEFEDSVQE